MATGKNTRADLEALFRAEYLYSGNASEAARNVGLPERTGRDLAKKLTTSDPEFADDRRALRARALDDLVVMRIEVAETAMARFKGTDAIDFQERGEGNVTIIDKRGEYGRLVLDAEKNAHSLAKIENPLTEVDSKTEVHIHLSGDEEPVVE